MTTYTVIWQEEGPYVRLDDEDDKWRHVKGERQLAYLKRKLGQ